MATVLKGSFAANGSSSTFVAGRATFNIGTDAGTTFGGGTVSIEGSHDGGEFTTLYTTTEEASYSTDNMVGGMVFKLVLSGSTSPALNYSVKYE